MAADRFSINKSWDHIQSKFVGTGHSDITKFEWASNQHRDTIASHIGHHDMLSFFAVAQNDAVGRVRYQLLEVGDGILCDLIYFICLMRFQCRKCFSPADPLQHEKMKNHKNPCPLCNLMTFLRCYHVEFFCDN
jgi:splicing factor 3B subunit 5